MSFRRVFVWMRASVYQVNYSLADIPEDTMDTSVSTNEVGEREGLVAGAAPQVAVVSCFVCLFLV